MAGHRLKLLVIALIVVFSVLSSEHFKNPKALSLTHETNENLSNPFGVAFGEGSKNLDHFMAYIHDLGISRTKVSFYWDQIEPSPGVYNWEKVDEYLSQIKSGDKVLLNVFTSGWGTNNESKKGATFKNKQSEEEYKKFIIALVKHTERKITYWQRDTEPASGHHYPATKVKEYVEAQKAFYEAVKSVQLDALVIGVNNNGEFKYNEPVNKQFFEYVIHYGGDYFDLLDVRLYKDIYDIPTRVRWFKEEMNKYGYNKPIVCTEFGGPDPREFPDDFEKFIKDIRITLSEMVKEGEIELSDQELRIIEAGRMPPRVEMLVYAEMRKEGIIPPQIDMFLPGTSKELEEKRNRIHFKDLIQRHLVVLSSGVKALWYWNLQSPGRSIIFGKMRLMDPNGWKKLPPYSCYQEMINHIGNIKSVNRVDTSDGNIYLFKLTMQNNKIKYVIWEKRNPFYGEGALKTRFEFNIGWKKAKITDVFGNTKMVALNNRTLSLDINDTPLYIENLTEKIVIILHPDNPYMTVNSVSQEIDPGRGTKPVIIPKWGRTVVPIRAIVEALGGTIGWDGTERKVTINFNGTTIELWIDNPKAKVNGTTKWIDENNHDVKPIIINDRTMLPLRFVAESLGCKVDWDAQTRTITITYTP